MRRQDKYPNTEMFSYLNLNPHNRITTDCVYRAIAKALCAGHKHCQKSEKEMWSTVMQELCEFAGQTGFVPTDTKCYSRFLKMRGFNELPQPRHSDGTKYTLKEFINENPKGVYLVNMPSHLTVVVDGVNYDNWDCTKVNSRIGKIWERIK